MAKTETTPAPSLMTDLSNLGISAYDYFQNKKAYDDIIQRYRDAMAQNTQASNNAIGLMNNAYDATAGYSKNKYDDLMRMVGQTSSALNQESNNQYDKSTAINANNLNTQNNQLANNLNTQNNLANQSASTLDNLLRSNANELESRYATEHNKINSSNQGNFNAQNNITQQGYKDTRNDLENQMNPAINAYNPYAQGGSNAQGLLNRFLTGDPNTRVADYVKTPGYDFRYKEGMNALDRSASARGALLGGGAIKEAMKYGQDMAQQGYDSYVNQLAGQSAQGLNATNAQGNLRQNYGTALGNTSANRANALSNAQQNYTTANNQSTGDYFNNVNNNTNNYNQGLMANAQNRYNALGQNQNQYTNAVNQNTGTYNQQALTNLNNSTNMNNDLIKFGYQEKTGATDNRYNDLANIVMGKNQNQANIGMQNQGVLNDILGKIASEQQRYSLNTQPEKNIFNSGSNILGNILGGGQSGGSTGGGIGGLFNNIFGSSGGTSKDFGSSGWLNQGTNSNSGSSWLNSIGSWF
jgi:hypothetical protein